MDEQPVTHQEQAVVDDEHPWPGLASFREEDEHFFKGRNQDIEKLFALVNRERLTVLFGVSGLGKSSLLQAGLFPLLRQENILPISIRLDFTDQSFSFTEQIFSAITRQVEGKKIEAPMHLENETLWEYFHRKDAEFWDARNRITIPLLCFDQFEEAFTLGREGFKRGNELKKFLIELADLVEGRCPENVKVRMDSNPDEAKIFNFSLHPYKLLFSLREDYLADLEGLRKLMPSLIHNRMRLAPMNGQQAMAVADQTQGRLMAHDVAESVVRLVAGKQGENDLELTRLRIEPALLSLVCRELNERRIQEKAAWIDAQSVASNREQILEDFFDRSLSPHVPELRRFIEDKLITVSGYRNSEAYDNAVGMPGITQDALDRLVQCRVLRIEERDGVKRIELIHDVLTGVVRKSRDQRQTLEKQRQAELERSEAEKREELANAALKAIKRRALAFLILTAVALVSSGWGWWSWWNAKESHKKAQHALAMADFREAKQHYEEDNIAEALAHLAHSVRLDPEWMSSRAFLVNVLQQKVWQFPTAVLKHTASLNMAAFSPDGTRVVTASQDNSARLWDVKTGLPIGEPMLHAHQVYSAQFSPDGELIVTASEDNSARLWSGRDGKAIGVKLMRNDQVYSAQFSPDGKSVVTASRDGNVCMWDTKTGNPYGDIMLHKDTVNTALFSPDGTRIVTASDDGSARLWNAKTGKPIGKVMPHRGDVYMAHFSPDGTRIVTASEDNSARLWDAFTGAPIGDAMQHQNDVYTALFSPDGKHIATGSEDKSARLWDGYTGKLYGEAMLHEGYVYDVEFSPDGKRVLTASGDNSARLWNADTGKALGGSMIHQDDIYSARFSPDGIHIVTASEDSSVRLWEAKIGRAVAEIMVHQGRVNSAQFNFDGTRLLTASTDHSARLWDTKTGKQQGEAMLHQEAVNSAQFNADGKQIVTASSDKTARLWDGKAGKPLAGVMTHPSEVFFAQFSPDSTRIVTASADNSARLWQRKTGKPLGQPMQHQGLINAARFSPNGLKVVTASLDFSARLWDAYSGKQLGAPLLMGGSVNSAEFSPDNARVLTASRDNFARLWDARTHKPVLAPMAHQYNVNSAQFNANGTRIVTASVDNSAQLWDADTAKPSGEAMAHLNTVNSAEFSADGLRVVTASLDNSARIWDSRTGKPLSDPILHPDNVTAAHFSPDGTRIVTTSEDNVARIWDVFPVTTDEEDLLPVLAETVVGYRLTELSAIEPLANQLGQLTQLKQATETEPSGKPTAESFIRWFLSDPWIRSVSPLSNLSVPDYIRQQIAAGRRDQMKREFPDHPLLNGQ